MGQVRQFLRRLRGWKDFLRVQGPLTQVLGPQYRRSRTRIELDITWLCNLTCPHCNRSCPQAPTTEHLSLEDIARFLDESKARNLRWEQIRVLGGELDFDALARLGRHGVARERQGRRVRRVDGQAFAPLLAVAATVCSCFSSCSCCCRSVI